MTTCPATTEVTTSPWRPAVPGPLQSCDRNIGTWQLTCTSAGCTVLQSLWFWFPTFPATPPQAKSSKTQRGRSQIVQIISPTLAPSSSPFNNCALPFPPLTLFYALSQNIAELPLHFPVTSAPCTLSPNWQQPLQAELHLSHDFLTIAHPSSALLCWHYTSTTTHGASLSLTEFMQCVISASLFPFLSSSSSLFVSHLKLVTSCRLPHWLWLLEANRKLWDGAYLMTSKDQKDCITKQCGHILGPHHLAMWILIPTAVVTYGLPV